MMVSTLITKAAMMNKQIHTQYSQIVTKTALMSLLGLISLGFSFGIHGTIFAAGTTTPAVPGNLIANAQMQIATVSSSTPDDWFQGGYGTNTVSYLYPVAGPLPGDKAAQVTLSNYTSGAAEWYFQNVPVTSGTLYNFSDSYNSNVESYLIAQWTMSDGSLDYDALATLPSTNGAWANSPAEVFPAPAGAVAVTVLHLIQNMNGTLTTANYGLTLYTSGSQPAFSKGMVSLTFDDGWASQYNNALPILNAAHVPGTFYIITDPVLDATAAGTGPNLFINSGISTNTVTASTTINWGNITNTNIYGAVYTDPTYQEYTFTDTYSATTTSAVTVDYCSVATSTTTPDCPTADVESTVLGSLPPGTNVPATFAFTLPVDLSGNTVTPISFSQSLTSPGTLTVSNISLVEYQDYMTKSQLQTVAADGNEIDSHTETHPDLDLTTLTVASATEEIDGSRSTLQSFGLSPVDGFAYPFGDYNTTVEQYVSAAGYTNARTVDVGFNTPGSNPLLLKSESAVASTTFPTIQSWIDTAVANKWWLVITLHDIDPENIILQNGETYGITPDLLQQIVSYLKNQNVSVVSMDEGLSVLENSAPPATTTPPTTPIATTTMAVNLVNDPSGPANSSDFNLTVTDASSTIFSGSGADTQMFTLNQGDTYSVTEATTSNLFDYTITPSSSCSGIAGPSPIVCSITNTFIPPATTTPPVTPPFVTSTSTVNVIVSVDNSAGGSNAPGDFTVSVNGANPSLASFAGNSSGTSVTVDATSTYSISASNIANYSASLSPECSDTLAAGASVTCTITETYVAPVQQSSGGGGVTSSNGAGISTFSGISYFGPTLALPSSTSTTTASTTPQGRVLGITTFKFLRNLYRGLRLDDVTELQNRLTAEGVYTGPITGYFGPLTEAGVKLYQAKYKIPNTGFVGVLTRGQLNSN